MLCRVPTLELLLYVVPTRRLGRLYSADFMTSGNEKGRRQSIQFLDSFTNLVLGSDKVKVSSSQTYSYYRYACHLYLSEFGPTTCSRSTYAVVFGSFLVSVLYILGAGIVIFMIKSYFPSEDEEEKEQRCEDTYRKWAMICGCFP